MNLFLAFVAIGMAFTHFFILPNAISSHFFISFLFVMFLLFGIEKIKEEQNKKLPNTYIVTAVILFIVLMTDLL